ncbi:MAG TPA: DUF4878 domain-containing protein [Spirochaetota bacterium]|nr:DUF4878 domain-containing protein [Spirochaetota bacterium]HNT09631.1 DUF4878 domain-containing protein [Spirochaetota bacterium]
MKRICIVALVAMVALVAVSCAKKKPSDIFTTLQKLGDTKEIADLKQVYTSETVKAMEELMKIVPKDLQDSKGQNKFPKEAKWDVVSEKIDGDTAEVKVKFSDHPMANMKGQEVTFKMKKEDGAWKIDLEKEMKAALALFQGLGGKDGLLKDLKKFIK